MGKKLQKKQTAPAAPTEASRLDQLAAEIKYEHEAVEASLRTSLMHAKAAGEKLIEVNNQLEHGQWMAWVEANCPFSYSTASLYVNIARRWDDLVNSQPVEDLTLHKAAEVLAELRRAVRAAEKAARPTKDAFHNEAPLGQACRLFYERIGGMLQSDTKEDLYLAMILHDRTLHHREIEHMRSVVFELRRRVNTAIDKLSERMAINVDELDAMDDKWREEEVQLNYRIAEIEPAFLNRTTRYDRVAAIFAPAG